MTLKELREKKGLSVIECASIVGVTRTAVYKWENQIVYPDMGKLLLLEDAYGDGFVDAMRSMIKEKQDGR